MATYSRRVVQTTRIEYEVPAEPPWGAAWAEVAKAVSAAMHDVRRQKGLPEDASVSDDSIWIEPRDDVIVVRTADRDVVDSDPVDGGSA